MLPKTRLILKILITWLNLRSGNLPEWQTRFPFDATNAPDGGYTFDAAVPAKRGASAAWHA